MSVVEMSSFNASIAVTELLTKTLENCARDLAARCIRECAGRYGFNAEEEIKTLGLENLALIRKQMAKKSGSKAKEPKKARATKEKKSTFPLPFISENVDLSGCQGLAYNRGLFTQCLKKSMENGVFCSGCQTESDKNASGCPDCGTVEARLNSGLYEFKDPKGRSPVSFAKVLSKLKLSQEEAMAEAGKKNLEIADEHFIVVTKVKKAILGRPKKAVGVVLTYGNDNVTDLFAKLTAEGEADEEIVEEQEEKPKKKTKLSDEEKAVKKAALESDRAAKKLEREAKIAEEKAEREEKRKAEAEQKKVERDAKIAEEKAEREAKRTAEKLERDSKKAAEKALKDAEKASKTKTKKVEAKAVEPVDEKPVAAQGKVSVSRIQIAGKQYLKSSNNILYDPETKEELGLWDPVSKTIKDLPEDDEEEQEEDYESN
jgi:chemotaxis protein histidine kinase CheA